MSSEILSVLEYMEKEKGIPRSDMIATITNALKTAAQKGVNSGQELKIDINPKNGQLRAWAVMKVVDSISNPKTEIHVEKAQAVKPGAAIGELIDKEVDPSTLGRIAAQTARQAVMQRLRQFEKDRIYEREHGRIRADPERQGHDHDGSEAGILGEHPHSETQILEQTHWR